MVLPNPLILISPPVSQVIKIKNDGRCSIQVAISNTSLPSGSPLFSEVDPGVIKEWQRTEYESVYINGGGFGRVVVAAAGPGTYLVPELQYADPNVAYVFNSAPDKVGVKNNLDTPIQVKITTNTSGSAKFFQVPPGVTDHWTRIGLETIFVKYSSSDVLLTYLGIPGQDLQINQQSTLQSGVPIYPYVQNVTASHINVFNEQWNGMRAKVSSGAASGGSELFYGIESGKPVQPNPWVRNEPEVIYVNGPTGTAVGTYYGKTGYTLNVNSPIAM